MISQSRKRHKLGSRKHAGKRIAVIRGCKISRGASRRLRGKAEGQGSSGGVVEGESRPAR